MRVVTKEHMDAIEHDLWGKTSEPEGRRVDDKGARRHADHVTDPEAEYPVDASIACLPHVGLAIRKDYRVHRSDDGERVTLNSAGEIRHCDAGGNISKGS